MRVIRAGSLMTQQTDVAGKIRVLISHREPLISAGLEVALGADSELRLVQRCMPETVLEAAAQADSAGVAVTDWASGLRLLSARACAHWRVLIVTEGDDELTARTAMEMGARGYLPLSSGVNLVRQAVRCIHAGGTALDPVVMTRIAVSVASPSVAGREMEMLSLMMSRPANAAVTFGSRAGPCYPHR